MKIVYTPLSAAQSDFLKAIADSTYWQNEYLSTTKWLIDIIKKGKYTKGESFVLTTLRNIYMQRVRTNPNAAKVKWKQ